MRLILFSAFFLLGSSLFAQKIPSTSVKNKVGESVSFSSLIKQDTIYIISFWATWCKPCIRQLEEISETYIDLQRSFHLNLIAVSLDDSVSSPKVFLRAQRTGWTYEVVLDQNQDLAKALGVQNVPTVLIVNRNREIVYNHSGYSTESLDDILTTLNKIR